MTFSRFHNALRILRAIDWSELAEAGLNISESDWDSFRQNPYQWFIRATEADAQKVWTIIERRQS